VVYSIHGGSDVLRVVDRPLVEPGPGEVRVKVVRSGVNPTDWKARRGLTGTPLTSDQVPGQDGSGVVDAVGEGVDAVGLDQRVWVWEAAYGRSVGTTQEDVVLPAHHVVPLPETASFDLGASLGIPFLTAHRCLTITDSGPSSLGPGTLRNRTVLVHGGAGAVGNAAIQLARWSGAEVIATVSSPAKATLARAAGAGHAIDYRSEDVVAEVRHVAPDGVDCIVEVAPDVNADVDSKVLAAHGAIAIYAVGDGVFPTRLLYRNARIQYVLVYTVSAEVKARAVRDVSSALRDGALEVGDDAGLPVHHYSLEKTGDAHDAVENRAVGKVLIDVDG
jgi:NADPH2:quinone reductase